MNSKKSFGYGRGPAQERIAAQLGLDVKIVRRYLEVASTAGVDVTAAVSDEHVRTVLLGLHPAGVRPRGDGWTRCLEQRAAVARWLRDGLRLTKIRKLLARQGMLIAMPSRPAMRAPVISRCRRLSSEGQRNRRLPSFSFRILNGLSAESR